MFIEGTSVYKVEDVESTLVFSIPPRRQLLSFSRYEWDEKKEYTKNVCTYHEVALPYMHFVLKQISLFGGPVWYVQGVVISVASIESVEDAYTLPVVHAPLPNFGYITPAELEANRAGEGEGADIACNCDVCVQDREELRADAEEEGEYIGGGCFNAGSYKEPFESIAGFWAQPFNADLFYQYNRHPFIGAVKDSAGITDTYDNFAEATKKILEAHEALSMDEVIKMVEDSNCLGFTFADAMGAVKGKLAKVDLEADYAS